jgi:fibronectin-binding autotransporter adhesin
VARRVYSFLIVSLALGFSLAPRSSDAQFLSNSATNIISGVVSNWTGDYLIGSNTFADVLLIQSTGVLSSGNGYLGYEVGADSNVAIVSDSNSVWAVSGSLIVGNSSVGDQLTVTNGASVSCTTLAIGNNPTSATNTVLVVGTSSSLFVAGDITVGNAGAVSLVTITNFAGAVCNNGTIGVSGSSNTVIVTGNSSWAFYGKLTVGGGGTGNQLVLGSGILTVTNVTHTASLDVQTGTFTLNDGTALLDNFTATNGAAGAFSFNGGFLISSATRISNTLTMVVGNGVSPASFQLNGGIYAFSDGLEVASNAAVSGCGTINGNVTVDPGGVVAASCGGKLTFSDTVTNNGTIQVVSGTALESYGTFVNNGVLDLSDGGPTNFLGAFINNGSVVNGPSVVISGNDVIVKMAARFFGFGPHFYQFQYTQSLSSNWTAATPLQPTLFSGQVVTFTDIGGATNQPSRFYRLRISL